MARFANDIRRAMNDLTKELERTLGPDTVELSLRIGLNSGPVTAGVLRGANCRFQLFGDTVNTGNLPPKKGASLGVCVLAIISCVSSPFLQL